MAQLSQGKELDMTKDLAPGITLTVKIIGMKKWCVRIWIGSMIIKLAALVMNVGIEIETKDTR